MVAVMAVAQRPSPKTQSLKILHQTLHQTQHQIQHQIRLLIQLLAMVQIQAPTPTIGRSCL